MLSRNTVQLSEIISVAGKKAGASLLATRDFKEIEQAEQWAVRLIAASLGRKVETSPMPGFLRIQPTTDDAMERVDYERPKVALVLVRTSEGDRACGMRFVYGGAA